MSVLTSTSTSSCHRPSSLTFYPLFTVRCSGQPVFRNQLARDVACLLDADDSVDTWSCQTVLLSEADESHRPDFVANRQGRSILVDVLTGDTPKWVGSAAKANGFGYEPCAHQDLPAVRLRNAKDLLRYARYQVTLDDRIRLLAALDEHGSLTLAECLPVFRETRPIAGIASMVLNRFIDLDLDEALIGPESTVRRRHG